MIRSRRVLTPDGVRAAAVHIHDGRIARVTGWSEGGDGAADVGDDVVMPGLVDTHVHVNEPGRTEWEGFATATRAAAAGGVTTLLDMPLNSIPATTSAHALRVKRDAVPADAAVNVELIGGVVPGNARELPALARDGVRAFKCFLSPSGVAEFDAVAEPELREAFPVLRDLGLPLMVHAEDPALLRSGPSGGSRRYADYLASRPAEAERAAIALLVRLLEWCPTPVHIVHLSSPTSIAVTRGARARGLPLTVETCPHYLTFAAEEIPDGATEYKCAPPIRSRADREGLWRGLLDGDIDLVASDHSPCPPGLKATGGDFFAAWGGIASLQLSLPATWTEARARGVPLDRLVGWMSAAPARLAGLGDRKGAISPGRDADLTIWSPETRFVVEPAALLHRHAVTPYAGRELYGLVRATLVHGRPAFGSV